MGVKKQIVGNRRFSIFSVEKTLYGKTRRLVVVFLPELHTNQRQTLENDLEKALRRLSALNVRLEARVRGEIRRGRSGANSRSAVRAREFLAIPSCGISWPWR